MASSHVEVKESADAGSNLPFEITTCESNGVDIQSNIDGEPPRDHTYNKDPDVISGDEIVADSEQEKDLFDDVQPIEKTNKSVKATRNAKQQKGTKSKAANKSAKSPAKKESVKKSSKKKVAEVTDGVSEEKLENDEPTATEAEDSGIVSSKPNTSKNQRKRRGDADAVEVDAKQMKTGSDSKDDNNDDDVAKNENEDDEAKSEGVDDEDMEKKPMKKQKVMKTKDEKTKPESKVVKAKKTEKKAPETKSEDKKKPSKSKDVGDTDDSLPTGWTKKVVERKSGKTAGSFDIYIYSPDGIKFRSKPDIAAYLVRTKSNLKLEDFNYSKKGLGKVIKKSDTSLDKTPPKDKKIISSVKSGKKKSAGTKKSAKIVVKISTPRKNIPSDKHSNVKKEEAKKDRGSPEKVMDDVKPSTSGYNSNKTKRGGRKK